MQPVIANVKKFILGLFIKFHLQVVKLVKGTRVLPRDVEVSMGMQWLLYVHEKYCCIIPPESDFGKIFLAACSNQSRAQ
jgi:hypothetical protein